MTKEDFLLIKNMIKDEINRAGFNKDYTGEVVSVSGENIGIKITGSEEIINNVKNKSGTTLTVGDEVYVEAINNKFSNIVVKYKI